MKTQRSTIAGALALATFLLAGCAEQMASAPPAPPPDPKTQMAALETRIFDLIQEQRRKLDPDAKALVLDKELATVARQRSQDMAAKNYMAHTGPDGQSSAGLLMDEDADFQGLLGENIAEEHFSKQIGVDPNTFADEFVKSWLASPEHRENLSFAAYDKSGVGAAVNGDTVYVTQLFATDLGLPQHAPDPRARKVTALDHPKLEPPGLRIPVPAAASDVPVPLPRPERAAPQ